MRIFKSISPMMIAIGVLWVNGAMLWGLVTALMVKDAQINKQEIGKNEMEFTVTMTSKQLTPIEFTYVTSDGTAKAGKDYIFTTGKGVIPLGEKKTIIKVPVITDNQKNKTNKHFYLSVTSSQITVYDGKAIGTIIENSSNGQSTNQTLSDESVKKDKQ